MKRLFVRKVMEDISKTFLPAAKKLITNNKL